MKINEEQIFLNDTQVRELQEHYLSTKGWRNDTESKVSVSLLNEIDRERQQRIASGVGIPRPTYRGPM